MIRALLSPLKGLWLLFCKTFGSFELTDGTIAEILYSYFNDETRERNRHTEVIRTGPYGYFRMEMTDVKTRDISEYEALIKDPVAWEAFEKEHMNRYFEDDIDMFPYSDSVNKRGHYDGEAHRFREIMKPNDFFFIQKEMIERRFAPKSDWSGRAAIGESDLRNLISCLRFTFLRNYTHLIVSRRIHVLTGSLAGTALVWAICGFDLHHGLPLDALLWAVAGWSALLAVLVMFWVPFHFNQHRHH